VSDKIACMTRCARGAQSVTNDNRFVDATSRLRTAVLILLRCAASAGRLIERETDASLSDRRHPDRQADARRDERDGESESREKSGAVAAVRQ